MEIKCSNSFKCWISGVKRKVTWVGRPKSARCLIIKQRSTYSDGLINVTCWQKPTAFRGVILLTASNLGAPLEEEKKSLLTRYGWWSWAMVGIVNPASRRKDNCSSFISNAGRPCRWVKTWGANSTACCCTSWASLVSWLIQASPSRLIISSVCNNGSTDPTHP